MGASNRRSHLQLEVSPPIGDLTSNQRCHLRSEVGPPIGGDTSDWGVTCNQRWDLQLEVTLLIGVSPPIGGVTSNWRSHLQLEVPPSGGIFSYHLGLSQYLITSRIIGGLGGVVPSHFEKCLHFYRLNSSGNQPHL